MHLVSAKPTLTCLQRCTVRSNVEIVCKTPELKLPSSPESSNYTIKITIILNGSTERKDLDQDESSISIDAKIQPRLTIEDHTDIWPPYDASKGESIALRVSIFSL